MVNEEGKKLGTMAMEEGGRVMAEFWKGKREECELCGAYIKVLFNIF